MPREPAQLYIGRKNCPACGRWKHDVDFKPRWKKFNAKPKGYKRRSHNPIFTTKLGFDRNAVWVMGPYYDTLCAHCRTKRTIEQQQARLAAMSPSQRAAWNKHRNELEKRRVYGNNERMERLQVRLARQIANAKAIIGQTRSTYNGDTLLPILPFRLYLLRKLRQGYTTSSIARAAKIDEAAVRRWAEGIYWEGECNPQPLHSVRLGNVDNILVALNESPFMLDELYPIIEEK